METNTHHPTRVPIPHEPMRDSDPVHAFVSGPVACRYLYFPQLSSERTTRREFRRTANGLRVPGVLPLVQRTTPGCFYYPIDFMEQFRLGSRSPGCSTRAFLQT